jgi:hypothetical protein
MKTKNIKCKITKERIDGELEELDIIESYEIVDGITRLLNKNYNFFLVINQDNNTEISHNPVSIIGPSDIFNLQALVMEYWESSESALNPKTQTFLIYSFLNYKAMINFLDIIYH